MSSPTVGPEIGILELQSQPAGSSHPICPPNRRLAVRPLVKADRELESLLIMTVCQRLCDPSTALQTARLG